MGRPKLYHTPEERLEAERRWRANASAETKARKAAYIATPEAKALAKERYARYRMTDGYRQAQSRYRESARGKATCSTYFAQTKAAYPERVKARAAIAVAIKMKVLVRPLQCSQCQRVVRPDAHHYLGYAPEHWFDVQWICRKCHKVAHLA